MKEDDVDFQYIVLKKNPADLATRGSTAAEISKCSLWWNGPSWLGQEESSWPTWNENLSTEMLDRIQGELKGPRIPIELIAVAAEDKNQREIVSLFGMDEKCCSSLRKLLRISVYVMKFIKMKVWSQLNHGVLPNLS